MCNGIQKHGGKERGKNKFSNKKRMEQITRVVTEPTPTVVVNIPTAPPIHEPTVAEQPTFTPAILENTTPSAKATSSSTIPTPSTGPAPLVSTPSPRPRSRIVQPDLEPKQPSTPQKSKSSTKSFTPIWIGLSLSFLVLLALFLFWRYRINRATRKREKEPQHPSPPPAVTRARSLAHQEPGFVKYSRAVDSVERADQQQQPGFVKYSRAVESVERADQQQHVHFDFMQPYNANGQMSYAAEGANGQMSYVAEGANGQMNDKAEQGSYPAYEDIFANDTVCSNCGYYLHSCQCGWPR
jgi:hypothetical protein